MVFVRLHDICKRAQKKGVGEGRIINVEKLRSAIGPFPLFDTWCVCATWLSWCCSLQSNLPTFGKLIIICVGRKLVNSIHDTKRHKSTWCQAMLPGSDIRKSNSLQSSAQRDLCQPSFIQTRRNIHSALTYPGHFEFVVHKFIKFRFYSFHSNLLKVIYNTIWKWIFLRATH